MANDTPVSKKYRILKNENTDTWDRTDGHAGYTCPATLPAKLLTLFRSLLQKRHNRNRHPKE